MRSDVETIENSFSGTPSNGQVLAVLGYHKIGKPSPSGWETWYYISEEIFICQLSYLKENGWAVLDLSTFLQGLAEPDILPERAALLTFDDGYRSMREFALPCLQKFDYSGVLFVPTEYIGRTNSFDTDVEPEEAICSWDDLRMLEQSRVSIQSHGASHRAFSTLSLAEQEAEIAQSKAVIEDNIGNSVTTFSFPYGDNGQDAEAVGEALKRMGYQTACLYGGGIHRLPIHDTYRMQRVAMGADTDMSVVLKVG